MEVVALHGRDEGGHVIGYVEPDFLRVEIGGAPILGDPVMIIPGRNAEPPDTICAFGRDKQDAPGLSIAAPAAVKRQNNLDPLGLGSAVEDVTNQVTGLVGSIVKRDPVLNGPPLISDVIPDVQKRDDQN